MEERIRINKVKKHYLVEMVMMMLAVFGIVSGVTVLIPQVAFFPFVAFAVASLLLIAYNVCSALYYFYLFRTMPSALVRYYLGNKIVRLLFCGMIIVAYILMGGAGLMVFIIDYFILYLCALIFESVFFVHIENKMNDKHDKN